MLIVALTGGIASGKSIVSQVLKDLGCYIHHADKIAHELMEPQKPSWEKIVARFGKKILNPDQTIDRSELGSIAFSNPDDLGFLNNLLHPLVFERKKEVIATLRKESYYKIFISEAALTVEAGFINFYDKVVVTQCDTEIQIKRLRQRDQISRDEALRRIQSQLPSKEKLKFADYIIDTSGSIPTTIEQSERVYRHLLQDYQLLYESR
jgi:dephospho-CoA kinase